MPSAPRKAIRKSMRSADSYGNPAKKQGVARATYKPGGLYSTGRAIAMAPGTKARGKFRDSDTRLGKTSSAKDRNMMKAQQRTRVTSAKPSKGPNKNTNKKYR